MSGLSSKMWTLARHPPDVLFGDAGDDFYRDEQKAPIEWRQKVSVIRSVAFRLHLIGVFKDCIIF